MDDITNDYTPKETIKYVDICCGLGWGDEAKGKIVAGLANRYNYVCRWSGGSNAGHTVYIDEKKYKTHLIPCGVFSKVKSIIGPDCVLNLKKFKEEIKYLTDNGFDTSVVKISPKTHIVTEEHIDEDIKTLKKTQGSTAQGIGPCYSTKYARKGLQAKDVEELKDYMWDGELRGKILCEGAQGYWLDINAGKYPYTTSSCTLPYGACSLGFSHQHIRKVYGAIKIYDTRSGFDPLFPESLMDDPELKLLGELGNEYGVTTGRKRIVNWLNLDLLTIATRETGTTHLVISKVDIIEQLNIFKVISDSKIVELKNIDEMRDYICMKLSVECPFMVNIAFLCYPFLKNSFEL
jgi:adenylosuccinate synthase